VCDLEAKVYDKQGKVEKQRLCLRQMIHTKGFSGMSSSGISLAKALASKDIAFSFLSGRAQE
jgi:hypothetical protein